MPLIRLRDKTPEAYTRESRDFQLFCNVFDCFLNGVKYDIDSMQDVVNTKKCPSRLLPLLATRLGFFSNAELTDDDLRMILEAYPHIIKNKGSEEAIRQCIVLFQRMRKINVRSYVTITNKNADGENEYSITIGLRTRFIDTYVLDELVKHIIPTGYVIHYVFIEKEKDKTTKMSYNDKVIPNSYEDIEAEAPRGGASRLRKGVGEYWAKKKNEEEMYGLLNAIEVSSGETIDSGDNESSGGEGE